MKKKVNLVLSGEAYHTVSKLAGEMYRNFEETCVVALSVLLVVHGEIRKGNKIIICTNEGEPLKELVLP
jgi:hypothetical protein